METAPSASSAIWSAALKMLMEYFIGHRLSVRVIVHMLIHMVIDIRCMNWMNMWNYCFRKGVVDTTLRRMNNRRKYIRPHHQSSFPLPNHKLFSITAYEQEGVHVLIETPIFYSSAYKAS